MNKNYEVSRKNNDRIGFNTWFDDFFGFPFVDSKDRKHPIMKTDINESEKEYTLEMDMPGFEKKDIEISLDNGYLTVKANKKEEKETNKNNYICRERYSGSYERSFYVGDIKEETIKANLNNGILTIVLPKITEEVETKKFIEIN